MKTIKTIGVFILISHFTLLAGVPLPRTHNPLLPYFMEQINFQSVLLNVYGQNVSGIIPDRYSDLNWNPAFILQSSGNSVYVDFNYQVANNSYNSYSNIYMSGSNSVSPNWYNNTSVNSLQLNPLFNFALIQKINDKISIAIINRSLFDYGQFRSSSNRSNYSNSSLSSMSYDSEAYNDLELTTVEVEKNQQSVWGTQTEFNLGYNFSPKIDIGLKFGHYIFRQSGELNDSRYSKQPHSLIDEYNNEDFKINGDQYEIGAGIVYHLDEKTNLGLYLSIMTGSSSEKNIAFDNSHSWSENNVDTNYYSINKYNLASNYSFSTDGSSPFLSLTFQKEFSTSLELRSFFSFRQTNKDITGSISSTDTSYTDRTFDAYNSTTHNYYFSRNESSGRAKDLLDGDGKETMENYQWFASLIYKPESEWSVFAAVMLQMQSKETEFSEKSIYYNNYNFKSYYYMPRDENRFNSQLKNYNYHYSYKKWSAIIPVGIKAHIYGGFSFLIGTDLRFDLIEIKESGDLLYPKRVNRTTENGVIVVEDIELNRPETYDAYRPNEFSKTSSINFGAFYEHSSGLKLYVKTDSDIFNNNFWTFGIEYGH
ncbi:MAG: hypothetical protein KKE09_11960 [Bacteroidetes bacterium]|nr:hypothetical protein [Bacteroidota bacterium]